MVSVTFHNLEGNGYHVGICKKCDYSITVEAFFIPIVISVLCAIVFTGLAIKIYKDPKPMPLDHWAFDRMQDIRTPSIIRIFKVVTWFSDTLPITVFAFIIFFILFFTNYQELAVFILFACFGTGILISFNKWLFSRIRPAPAKEVFEDVSTSFPSGHALGSCGIYVSVAYVITQIVMTSVLQPILLTLSLIAAILIGFSRLVLELHWITDILGGFLIAGCWLGIVVALHKYVYYYVLS